MENNGNANHGKLYINTLIRNLVTFSFSCGLMLLGAGRMDWPRAIVFWIVYFLISLAAGFFLIKMNYGLMKERQDAVFKKDAKRWDRWILAGNMILNTALYILVGVDAGRYGWSRVPWMLQIGGIFFILSSFALTLWAAHENQFMSSQVRIQSDRGHHVIMGGPYAIIRHPMYTGYCLLYIGLPLALNSWWGLIISTLLIVIIIIRTLLEEETLIKELSGYLEYTGRTRFRLLPGIW
jgi:protein-S-isoprenylcysteine O-methyltransferase Ste14